jgi:hypothetical protein
MNRRSLLVVAMIALGSTLVGCGPRWGIVAQAAPNPFMGQKKFAVLPIDYAGLRIGNKTEADYVANKGDKQADSFQEDKVGINDEFAKALTSRAADEGVEIVLATGPASAPFAIHPSVSFLEPGFYAYVASRPSQVSMTVQITSPEGKVLDEITTTQVIGADITNPSIGGRYRSAGKALGAALGKYLKLRTGAGG